MQIIHLIKKNPIVNITFTTGFLIYYIGLFSEII